jgi:hypothetical protein
MGINLMNKITIIIRILFAVTLFQHPLLLQNQADGMDVAVADRMEALKKKDGPSRTRLKSIWLSILHV